MSIVIKLRNCAVSKLNDFTVFVFSVLNTTHKFFCLANKQLTDFFYSCIRVAMYI